MRQKQRRHFFAALAGTLPDVIAKLNRKIASISNMPDAEEKLRQLGTEVTPNNTPENLTQFLHVGADAVSAPTTLPFKLMEADLVEMLMAPNISARKHDYS